ncbi:glutathione S-transferase family protein [Parvularcula bermudensis HTCC2503]|uniref:Glutathione S-transferase family protein n=1 Tax=Parvularcula bermudensis (strain ATCC BAA-594 / HTCC2503 / KCTC 12087) TaxID=314260 RepID=E0TC86_PARBH|nr:glutathione S-transferase family protein [Parvularcula bermudensis]ADM08519.1 glutathione S-transferase family protein [Parvularcula bermudensis HTCC2503]
MTLTIYHAKFARSVRLIWACEEMDVPYTIETVELRGDKKISPDVHPLQKVPAMIDGDVHMFESLAILDYILARYNDALRPKPDHPDYPAYLQWYHFGESTLAFPIMFAMAHRVLLPERARDEKLALWAQGEAEKAFEAMAAPLEKNEYLLPSGFSAADISCAYMLLLSKFSRIMGNAPEAVKAYFARIAERPAWKTATAA